MTPDSFVKSGEVQLAVYYWNEKTGGNPLAVLPVVVLVHGYPDAAAVWETTAEHLARRYRVVAYDVRGAGNSGVPDRTAAYGLDHLVADLAGVVDAVSPERPIHLVAHDWGSIQSWEAVSTGRLAGRIASFTSISGPCLDHVGHWMARRLRGGSRAHFTQVIRQLVRSWYIGLFHLPRLAPALWKLGLARAWPAILDRTEGIRAEARASQARDGSAGIGLYRANFSGRLRNPQIRRTDVPVQLLVPRRDRFMVPEIWDDLPRWVPNLWRRDIDAGHWLQLSHPRQLADWVGEFVDFVDGAEESPELRRSRVG